MIRLFRTIVVVICLGIGQICEAADQFVAFDPLTVKVGEEMRITLFNPSSEAIEVRVFAYNAVEGTYDEGPKLMLAAGKLRFFDFKAPKEFVGIGGVVETVPEPPVTPSRATGTVAETKPDGQKGLMLTDLMVSSVISKGSLQHRSSTGQSQTMGYSFGANQQNGQGWGVKSLAKSARQVTTSSWVVSPEF